MKSILSHITFHWKTSLMGLLISIPQIIIAFQTGDYKTAITGISTIILGLLAADPGKALPVKK